MNAHTAKNYRCDRCGHVEQHITNHYGPTCSNGHYHCCPKCPPHAKYPEYGGQTRWTCIDVPAKALTPEEVLERQAETIANRITLSLEMAGNRLDDKWETAPELAKHAEGLIERYKKYKRTMSFQLAERFARETMMKRIILEVMTQER